MLVILAALSALFCDVVTILSTCVVVWRQTANVRVTSGRVFHEGGQLEVDRGDWV